MTKPSTKPVTKRKVAAKKAASRTAGGSKKATRGSGTAVKATRKAAAVPEGARNTGRGAWQPAAIDRMRRLIREADPDILEEVKWRKPSNAMQGVPVWSHDGIVCTGETYKDKVKLTFARGAALDDPGGLFNAKDTGATRRAIDIQEGDTVDSTAFKALVRAAVAFNAAAK
ncbi:MAG TPA: DUF1801 domain-containing protein [Candidatus Thermoplasmatota archaeon]|nr:DUF1801 domain-containing protein [Candidatus Thermoplasmatota archaeon]